MQNETQEQVENINEKIFSEAEIKKRLKNKSKSELIQIIIYLSKKIDELKIKKED